MNNHSTTLQFLRSALDCRPRPLIAAIMICLASGPAPQGGAATGPVVTGAEMAEARSWAAAKLQGVAAPKPPAGYLEIPDPKGTIGKNAEPGGPLQVARQNFRRGLYTGSVTRLTVHLPGPARTFEAVAALDLNWWGQGNRGESATFSVEVGGREAAQSGSISGGAAGVPVKAALGGATEFTLVVNHPPKSPVVRTGLWADARVTLEDGRTVWLDELPVAPLAGPFTAEPPFSFTYGGRASADLLKEWTVERTSRPLDPRRTEHTARYRDPQTGLVVRVAGVEYLDYPMVEWTVHFENTGSTDTPILENIRALDARVERNGDGEFVLHHFKGSQTTPTDYEPYATTLGAGQAKELVSRGWPTSNDLCYFNVARPGSGVIIGLGWPGQWSASFTRDEARGLRLQAGQARTHFKLHPGEQVRTPLVVLQFWHGDEVRAQNIWRRWMLAHNVPRPGGKPLEPVLWSCYMSGDEDYAEIDEAKNISALQDFLNAGIKLDIWEMDAGWYVNNGRWQNTGTWEPDPKRFPRGLGPLLDFVHSKGLKTHIWFEPERVTRGTWLWDNRPEWLLRSPEWENTKRSAGDSRLLNLGDPAAYRWMVDMLDGYIRQGIDFYRTDFNFDPLPFWQAADAAAPDRVGITENKYVVGFLAYFDELTRRHPNLLLDTCAGGGRRIDLETLRRAIPVTRSDYFAEPVGVQNITYGIASWVPIYGTGTIGQDPYTNRSAWGPWPGIAWDLRRPGLDLPALRRMTEECRTVSHYFYGDYYPLTPYSTANSAWMAWQFDRPDLGTGMVQAFRRAQSPYASAVLNLRGLDPEATYELTDLDQPGTVELTGRQLMEKGLTVTMPEAPTALIYTYRIKPRK